MIPLDELPNEVLEQVVHQSNAYDAWMSFRLCSRRTKALVENYYAREMLPYTAIIITQPINGSAGGATRRWYDVRTSMVFASEGYTHETALERHIRLELRDLWPESSRNMAMTRLAANGLQSTARWSIRIAAWQTPTDHPNTERLHISKCSFSVDQPFYIELDWRRMYTSLFTFAWPIPLSPWAKQHQQPLDLIPKPYIPGLEFPDGTDDDTHTPSMFELFYAP